MRKTKFLTLLLALGFCLFVFVYAGAQSETTKNSKTCSTAPAKDAAQSKNFRFAGIEVLSGFGTGHLRAKGRYDVIPIFVDFDFDIKPWVKKIGLNPPGLVQFVEEPFIAGVSNPNGNIEVGNNFLLKIGLLPETSRIQPYIKGGVGFLYISQHSLNQGSQFNFNEYAGFGIHFFLKKNVAFTVEYRYRHLSNCDIEKPNSGINNSFGILGLSYIF